MFLKQNKGITLIALVITIIVLLILAGVTISLVLGDDGIIANAQASKLANQKSQIKEMVRLHNLDIETAEKAENPYSDTEIDAKVEALLGEIQDMDGYGEICEIEGGKLILKNADGEVEAEIEITGLDNSSNPGEEPGEEPKEMITFKLDSALYEVEKGTTWREFLESPEAADITYYDIEGNYIFSNHKCLFGYFYEEGVAPSECRFNEMIDENYEYVTDVSATVAEGHIFTINGEEFYALEDMDWKTWAQTHLTADKYKYDAETDKILNSDENACVANISTTGTIESSGEYETKPYDPNKVMFTLYDNSYAEEGEGTEYMVDKGTTWQQWIEENDYYTLEGSNMVWRSNSAVICEWYTSANAVKYTDTIESTWYVHDTPDLGDAVVFYIDGNNYYALQNMSMFEWVTSRFNTGGYEHCPVDEVIVGKDHRGKLNCEVYRPIGSFDEYTTSGYCSAWTYMDPEGWVYFGHGY